jgi:L-lysine 6-transaminase
MTTTSTAQPRVLGPEAAPAVPTGAASELVTPPGTAGIKPTQVMDVLRRHMLVDGFPIVVDLDRSHGSWLVDAATGKQYLDLFMFFASAPIGFNHPRMLDAKVMAQLARASLMKPSNSDFYTVEMAEFVDTFEHVAMPTALPHLFLISGGALGVENALKAAFDWKVRKNFARGYRTERGTKVLHFEQAFHGRSGYTLSLTNTTDARKTKYFPKFDWPRVVNPKITFPLSGKNLDQVIQLEKLAVAQMERAFRENQDDIAAIILEPIQGEGGDNHFRPEFFAELRRLADENEALLIFDEVQTGVGLTGRMWAYEHFGVTPDFLCFGKKMQICGMLAGKRIDEVPDNVFAESSRINSTWGGSLVDMVRSTQYMKIIHEDRLVDAAAIMGQKMYDGFQSLQREFPNLMQNVRGRGLMCAFDLSDATARDRLLEAAFDRELLVLATGTTGVRFRPSLALTQAELDEGLNRLRDSLEHVRKSRRTPAPAPGTK